jgi:hypothetical protein
MLSPISAPARSAGDSSSSARPGAHETLTHDAGTLGGTGEFRHDRFPLETRLAGLPGPLRLGRAAGQVRGVQGGRPLQVTDLLPQRIDLRRLLLRLLMGGDRRGRRDRVRTASGT